ncbi:MAG TPA: ATP-grasp domain-containing protein [Trebonia sp.]
MDTYDIFILDASNKQSLTAARSLGRAGLRVALGEIPAEPAPGIDPPAFRSRHCARAVVLPDYATDPVAYAEAVVAFAERHRVRVVLPATDATCTTMAPYRECLTALGCTLALAPDPALETAFDKDKTLRVARELGIGCPESVRVDDVGDLPAAAARLGFPLVIKPTMSWTGKSPVRVVPVDVIDEAEAVAAAERVFEAGAGVLAQQWLPGRREGVTCFIIGGEVMASCGHVAHRTTPQLGGASVLRESIEVTPDVYDASVRLAKAIGIEGICEVEFRRDADGRPLLMEINPRLAGTLENALRAGVDFPLLIWQFATGQPVSRVHGSRTGVRTRWLHGDLRWLRDNQRRAGRPDSVPRIRGFATFAGEFTRTRYYDFFDPRDMKPALAELRYTAAIMLRSRRRHHA